ncbi:MAG: hypothetical protein IT536_08765, partial [Hyphomicrobiales bacterium]|nr:hypothetical protein [Hyphomicrobiales bacterium]
MGFWSRSTAIAATRAIIAMLAAALTAGCFQPLYGERSVSGAPQLREALRGVDVAEIRAAANTPEARMAVPLQNDLRFNFTGGSGSGRPTHRLVIQMTGSRAVVSA